MAGAGHERIALTGASGFIGGRLLATLLRENRASIAALVRSPITLPEGASAIVGDLTNATSLADLCAGAATVFHCAGFAHALDDGGSDFAQKHWQINFEGTRDLVEAAGRAGVRHFVHLSSIKAMPDPGAARVDEDRPGEPDSPYGKAKRAAELAVLEAGARYGMQVVNLRPAMVYGPGSVRGNLDRMARLIRRGWFPPLPETMNRRSVIFIDDLIAAMRLVAADPRANGRSYIVADPVGYSGRRIYELLCEAMGIHAKRWAVHASLLRAGGLAGDAFGMLAQRSLPLNSEVVARLLESAWYSPQRIERELGWRAEVSLPVGLARTYAPPSR
jgi:nucleoside-diphosphate-sugar epimerase